MSFILVDTEETRKQLLGALNFALEVAVDTESTNLDPFLGKLLLVQFNIDGVVYIIDTSKVTGSYLVEVMNSLQEIGCNGVPIIFHNAKFDIKFLYTHSGVFLECVYDTQTAEVLLTAGVGKIFYSLSELTKQYCDVRMAKDVREDFYEATTITQEMLVYASKDVLYLPEIRKKQLEIAKKFSLLSVFDLEMSLIPVVARMELDGVLLDTEEWTRIYNKTVAEKEILEKEILNTFIEDTYREKFSSALEFAEALKIPVRTKKKTEYLTSITEPSFMKKEIANEVNLGSYIQLREGLNLMGIPVENTSKQEFLAYKDQDIISKLLRLKMLNKRISTYGLDYFKYIHPLTGRIHPEANQVGTKTGRFIYMNPNLQQIPTDTEEITIPGTDTKKIVPIYRNCFIARPGYLLYTIDYSQAELRIAGAVSGETKIIEAYRNGIDVHTLTASIIFKKPLEEITSKERSRGKTINFSILYGSTAYGINKKNPDISLAEAEELLANFFSGYPRLKAFLDLVAEYVWENKYSVTPLGRIRFFENQASFDEPWKFLRYKSEMIREGQNLIIQGCSADALKIAMVRIARENPFSHDDLAIRIQIHDELVIEVKEDIKDEAKEFIDRCFIESEQMFLGEIPAEADGAFSKSWTK